MKKQITVIGSFVVDLMARAKDIPLQGETVKGGLFKMGPGGKGSNQAVAAHRSGGNVTLVTKVGKDVFGTVATDFYKQENMDTRYIFEDNDLSTGIALIMVSEKTSQNSIMVVPGACSNITQEEIEEVSSILGKTSVLLSQLETNLDILPGVIDQVHQGGGIAILNPAPAQELDDEFIGKFDIVTPNETEASSLSGVSVVDRVSAEKAAKILIDKGIRYVIITLGSHGSFLMTAEGEGMLFPPIEVAVVDTTGAGDAFNGGLATALYEGKSLRESVFFAMVVASLSVTKMGTAPAMPTRLEIDNFLQNFDSGLYWKSVK
jgi:ribokinase